jgi:hypothetical protein
MSWLSALGESQRWSMQLVVPQYGSSFTHGTAVLMARLVAANGQPIQPQGVSAIDCAIYEVDPCWPNNLTAAADCNNIALTVANVVFDSLQTDRKWTIDDVGYNFLHEIITTRDGSFPKVGFCYEVRYRFTSSHGKTSIIRFLLKASRHDR